MTNIAYEKISLYIRDRDKVARTPERTASPDPSSRRENVYYQKKAGEFLRKSSRRQGDRLGVFPPGQEDIYGKAMSRACKKYFVDAVLNYTYEKSIIKEALLAFRIPASKYYYWKSGARDDLLKS